ncbi:MAG: hypothetical protein CFE21_03590 [Bacteroidetes bacterium B1(2017)]|nr:MAG: hypothetical protein CFE21_03590 [Bacteroidetes bacterium B1(2017)]
METKSFIPLCESNSYSNKDVLSVFKETPEKDLTIRQGMSVKEISDVVTERIMALILEQFEATKIQFESEEKIE